MGPPIYIGGNGCFVENQPGGNAASMGPPIYIGGNDENGQIIKTKQRQLQWGHRFTSVETHPTEKGLDDPQSLQWGHRFTSVET